MWLSEETLPWLQLRQFTHISKRHAAHCLTGKFKLEQQEITCTQCHLENLSKPTNNWNFSVVIINVHSRKLMLSSRSMPITCWLVARLQRHYCTRTSSELKYNILCIPRCPDTYTFFWTSSSISSMLSPFVIVLREFLFRTANCVTISSFCTVY